MLWTEEQTKECSKVPIFVRPVFPLPDQKGKHVEVIDLKGGKWVDFDGNLPHCTLPFTGTRYTLIVSAATAGRLGLWLALTVAATTLTESVGANSTSSTRATATSAPAASTTSRRFATPHPVPTHGSR